MNVLALALVSAVWLVLVVPTATLGGRALYLRLIVSAPGQAALAVVGWTLSIYWLLRRIADVAFLRRSGARLRAAARKDTHAG